MPQITPEILALFRCLYGAMLIGTLAWSLPHARRFFQSERWGGYGQSCPAVDAVQNPVLLPFLMALWFGCGVCLIAGFWPAEAALVNLLLCRYFFLQMRWKGVLRGMGAPGYMTCWLAAAVFALEFCSRHAPSLLPLGLLVLQVDFALIMFVAGWYKFNAGYAEDEGMEYGMVNPQWGYWWRTYRRVPPSSWFFRFNNHMAWGGEVLAGVLMLLPATRFYGAFFVAASFVYIGLNIRLLLLAPMVMLASVLFCGPATPLEAPLRALAEFAPAGSAASWQVTDALLPILSAALWTYLALLPAAYAGMFFNFYYRRTLPGRWQSILEHYTNFFGLILWRVFSADVTQFYINILRRDHASGRRELVTHWGIAGGLRYSHVAEAITVTSLFTTLKYYPSNNQLFQERLLRYARTVPCPAGWDLVFEYVRISKAGDRFHDEPVAEYEVDPVAGTVTERTLDETFSVRAPAPKSAGPRGQTAGQLFSGGEVSMCGIAGMFGCGDAVTARAMLDTLIHRGPDDGHLVAGDRFVLGARRLSIVDLSGGRQPMANEDGTIWAAQNGELYNYPEERPLLEARGHRFATHCDTEMIPHLYEDHGTDLAKRLDGMFAICLWDTRNQTGLLLRDRTGKKPLYYYQSGECLYFASEIKALLRVPGFERRLNLEALHHYLALKHVPAPLSIFQGVRQLPPAHALVYHQGAIQLQRYWRPDYSGGPALSEEEAVEEFLGRFKDAVRRRLMADVPIGFFLSGGLDSSLTTAVAAELCPGRVKTFTLTYGHEAGNAGKDEDRRWARWVAEKYQTDHHEEVIEFGDFPSQMRLILGHFDEPFAGVVSTYYLSRLIRKHVKVAVSGDGADELFGSYLSHRLAFPLANYDAYLRSGDVRLIRPFEEQTDRLKELHGLDDADWRARLMTFSDAERYALYAPDVAAALATTRTDRLWHDVFGRLTARDPLNRILESEFLTIFPDQVLAFVDRLSMAHSLEVRTAFLDTRLVEFVAGLPGRMKIKDGETKYLLKRAAEHYFPSAMVHRKKEGFLMPITQWLLRNLRDYVHDTLHPDRLRRHGLFRPEAVQRLVEQVYAGPSDYTMVNKVYALVVFEEWFDLYLNAALPAARPVFLEGAVAA